ncbi:MAG: DinB family protein [Spirosomataceae bacterium]
MIPIHSQINTIRQTINECFDSLDYWLNLDNKKRSFHPLFGGWTINEILEHISLTNYFLLILIKKGTQKALKNVNNLILVDELKGYHFLNADLEQIGKHKSFTWIRPEHMEPQGGITLNDLKHKLENQRKECLYYLDSMPNGEGVLYKTTMTVNGLGKIDVYQYIHFLAMHIHRHLEQMTKIENDYQNEL